MRRTVVRISPTGYRAARPYKEIFMNRPVDHMPYSPEEEAKRAVREANERANGRES